ncbi:MAG: hypothetical protein F6K39_18220 [Okeania sp. SIO3B3]|nr:hypothetical protein [Okeania sp. SIO3B3]
MNIRYIAISAKLEDWAYLDEIPDEEIYQYEIHRWPNDKDPTLGDLRNLVTKRQSERSHVKIITSPQEYWGLEAMG